MSAFWVVDKLKGKAAATALSEWLLRLDLSCDLAYVVSNEYVIDQEIISRAITESAKYVLFYQGTEVSTEAEEFAESCGVHIWPAGRFLKAAERGEI